MECVPSVLSLQELSRLTLKKEPVIYNQNHKKKLNENNKIKKNYKRNLS